MHGMAVQEQSYIYRLPCQWFALLTESGKERQGCIWLRRRKYEPYWPRYRGQVRLNRHRRAMRWRSVLPGYLFLPISLTMQANWELIEQMPGFRRVMRTGNGTNYAELTEHDIGNIERIEMALQSSIIAQGELIPFSVGQTVRFTNANLWALQGRIKAIDGKRRIIVTVDFFNTKTDMTVPANEIEAV